MANATQRTLLFLIADTGAGHRSAANAINNALKLIEQQQQEEWHARQRAREIERNASGNVIVEKELITPAPPTYRVVIVDVFEEYSRFPLREAVKLYGPAIRYNPKLYGEVFHLSNRVSNRDRTVSTVESLSKPLIHNGLLRLITSVQPDVIISIHPLLNHVTVRALRDLSLKIPLLTVITDLVSIHKSWYAPGVDSYVVPTDQARRLCIERGADSKHVHLLGMPIDPKFTRPTASKEELRAQFGLKPGLPAILLVGGGDGAGGLQKAVRAISRAHLPVQLMVVTGRNRRLYAHLQRTKSNLHVPAKIFGFVQNMPELMRAADVLITKAGPGTICEALSCDLPLIISGYVPGQEEGNIDYVVENDVGVLALDAPTLIHNLRLLIKPGSPDLRRRVANARRISHPRASFDIATHILSFLPAPEKASVWQSAQWRKRKHLMSSRLRSAIRLRRLRRHLPRPGALLRGRVVRRLNTFRIRGFSDEDERNI